MSRFAPVLAVVLCAGIVAFGATSARPASSTAPGIANIVSFLEQCPTNDPVYAQIRADFEIRREGVVIGDIPCSEPVSAMPISQYTDEMIAVQALRAIYYMEGGRQVAYPWTSGSLYDWMKSKVGGFDLSAGGSNCCASYNGKWYPRIATQPDWDRDYDRKWEGISNQITLMAHETRHVDGFGHVGYCPLFPDQPYGCDPEYDEGNLSAYAIEWWLNAKWLSGQLYVGFSCASAQQVSAIASFHQSVDNQNFGQRFAANPPPTLSIPAQPGGVCQTGGQTATPTPAPTPVATPAASPTPTPTPTPSPSPAPAPTASPTPSATPTPSPGAAPSPTDEPVPTPTDLPPPPAPTNTPTPAASASAAPSATPVVLPQANVNCDGVTDFSDVIVLLRASGGLGYHGPSGCAAPGDRTGATTVGDVDCSGVFDVRDVLALLRFLGGLPPGDCSA